MLLGFIVGVCLYSAVHYITCFASNDIQLVGGYFMAWCMPTLLKPWIGIEATITNTLIMTIDIFLIIFQYRTIHCVD